MISLTYVQYTPGGVGIVKLELPETEFGISFNRYQNLNIRYYCTGGILVPDDETPANYGPWLNCAVVNPDFRIRRITLAKIPIDKYQNVLDMLNRGIIDSAIGPTYTIANGENLENEWQGIIISNTINFTFIPDRTGERFTVSFDFLGKRVKGNV